MEDKVQMFLSSLEKNMLNPITPMSDQDRISPYNINTISRKDEMRIRKISIRKILVDLIQILQTDIIRRDYGRVYGELLMRTWQKEIR